MCDIYFNDREIKCEFNKFNEIHYQDEIFDKKKVIEKKEEEGYCTLFKNTHLRKYILVLPLIWFLDAFAFFVINFMIKYFKGGIYLNNTIIFASELISYSISFVLLDDFKSKGLLTLQ